MSFNLFPENTRSGTPDQSTPLYRLPKPSGRSLETHIGDYVDPNGKRGVPVRELKAVMHMAAETLKAARVRPGRLCMGKLFELAQYLGIPPGQLVADVFHQADEQYTNNPTPTAREARARAARPTTPDADAPDVGGADANSPDTEAADAETSDEPAPETAEPDPPALFLPDKVPLEEVPPEEVATAPRLTQPLSAPNPIRSPAGLLPDSPADPRVGAPTAVRLPLAYTQAAFWQRSQALSALQQTFERYFPTLPWLRWSETFDALRPQLWPEEEQGMFTLAVPELRAFIDHLIRAPEMPPAEQTDCVALALYLALLQAELSEQAAQVLTELEQHPQAYGRSAHALVLRLATGDQVAEQVLGRLTGRSRLTKEPAPAQPVKRNPAGAGELAPPHRLGK